MLSQVEKHLEFIFCSVWKIHGISVEIKLNKNDCIYCALEKYMFAVSSLKGAVILLLYMENGKIQVCFGINLYVCLDGHALAFFVIM